MAPVARAGFASKAAGAILSLTAAFAACPPGFSVQASGYCYGGLVNASGGSFSWTTAQAACQAMGAMHGNLASFRDAAQQSVVLTQRCGGLLPAVSSSGKPLAFWIGLNDDNKEGTMQWVSGASTTFFGSTASVAVLPRVFDNGGSGGGGAAENFVLAYHNGTLADSGNVPSQEFTVGACCEAAAVEATGSLAGLSCPASFSGPDASGFCYSLVDSGAGFTWDQAAATCRALNGGQTHLAAVIDTTTATSVVDRACNTSAAGASLPFWIGLQHTAGGSTNRLSPGWKWLASGHRNDYMTSPAADALWFAGSPSNSNGNVRSSSH